MTGVLVVVGDGVAGAAVAVGVVDGVAVAVRVVDGVAVVRDGVVLAGVVAGAEVAGGVVVSEEVAGAEAVNGVVGAVVDGLGDGPLEVLGAASPVALGPQPLSERAAMASPAARLAHVFTCPLHGAAGRHDGRRGSGHPQRRR